MNFPRFWAKGQTTPTGSWFRRRMFESWGWSDVTVEDARRRGEENARRVAEKFAAEGGLRHRRRQYYEERPFREQVLQTIEAADGARSAVITRNSYGCLVLNTAGVMFVDVDLEEGTGDADGSWWSRFLGESRTAPPPKDETAIIERARQWADQNAGWGWRVYRTRAGLRLVATHELFVPETMATSPLFDTLTADPLYRKLCQNQKCFRARLSPKPWRCDVPALSVPWPREHPNAERRFLKWEKQYEKAAARFSTCELMATLGSPDLHPEIAPIMRLHDTRTRVETGLPLA